MSQKTSEEGHTYQQMFREVEQIIEKIQGESLELDAMVGEVKKAHGLIQAMRTRLQETQNTIEQLKADLQDHGESESGPGAIEELDVAEGDDAL